MTPAREDKNPLLPGGTRADMANDEAKRNVERAKDYVARFEALQAKYPNAKTWGDFSQGDIDEMSELIISAEEFLAYALKRGKIPKELSKRLDQLVKRNDLLGYELNGK